MRKIFQITNISYPLIRTSWCTYQGSWTVSFLENFAYVLNEWMIPYFMNPWWWVIWIYRRDISKTLSKVYDGAPSWSLDWVLKAPILKLIELLSTSACTKFNVFTYTQYRFRKRNLSVFSYCHKIFYKIISELANTEVKPNLTDLCTGSVAHSSYFVIIRWFYGLLN